VLILILSLFACNTSKLTDDDNKHSQSEDNQQTINKEFCGHIWDDGIEVEGENGGYVMEYTCTVCGEKDQQIITIIPSYPVTKDDIVDKVYLYETSKNNGRKMVVGEFTIKEIIDISKNRTKLGCYYFIDDYAKYILKDKTLYDRICRLKNIKITDYNQSYLLNFLFFDDILDYAEKNNRLDDMCKFNPSEEYKIKREKAEDLMEDCDKWLNQMGFYNEDMMSYWNYAIVIDNPIKYTNPLSIADFKGANGKIIQKAPQSWCYCERINNGGKDMFDNEVLVTKEDKERLIKLIEEANIILEKYPYFSKSKCNTVTTISRAKDDVTEYDAILKILKNRHTGVNVGKKLMFNIDRKRFYSAETEKELNRRYFDNFEQVNIDSWDSI
jgi:predicted transcriptional regulator